MIEPGGGKRLGRFFSIRKSYFLQVKSLILVGTLEKDQFLILIIPKAFLTCGCLSTDRNIIIAFAFVMPNSRYLTT
ncbi:hypothetical protein BUQ74_12890 [Leptospira weilii serovar Heyan]|nr:hypothetical protein BUQ74_12890 [Leptospira weilii serovar Heyan]